jgi:ferritin-like metal-binding protein YciE
MTGTSFYCKNFSSLIACSMSKNNNLGKNFPPSDSHLNDFFTDQLRCLFAEEKEMTGTIAMLEEAASMKEFKELFACYLKQINQQALRLEEIFIFLLIKPHSEPPAAILGLIKEVERIVEKTPAGSNTRDAALIIAAQKVFHYKIATYGSLVQLATSLGMEDVTNLLAKSLQDEKDKDLLFSDLADKRINWLAETE